MNTIFHVKHVGQVTEIKTSKGETLAKRTIVLTTKECRSGDLGTYVADLDFVVDLLGDKATQFNLNPGEWLAAELYPAAREYQGSFFGEMRLQRFCKM